MLNNLLQTARENMTRREKAKALATGEQELLSLAKPLIQQAVDITERSIDAAQRSDQRFEEFSEKYSFYDYLRRAPAFLVLATGLNILNGLSRFHLGLQKWQDEGPSQARRLAGLVSFSPRIPARHDFDEEEAREADQKFRAMQVALIEDCKPLLSPIEKFSHAAHECWDASRPVLDKYEKDGIRLKAGISIECVCFAETIMGQIVRWPGSSALIKREKHDLALWQRLGQPLQPKRTFPPLVKVYQGFETLLIPLSDLPAFLAGQPKK